jgi:hypothetical protein
MLSRTFVPIALVCLLLAGASLTAAADEVRDRKIAELGKNITALRAARLADAIRFAEASQAAYESGSITLDVVLDAIEKRAAARLAVATTASARLAAYEERLNQLQSMEQKVEALYKTGSRGGEEIHYRMIRCARETAEIALLEETLEQFKAVQAGGKNSQN